jgi:hypothetical protein
MWILTAWQHISPELTVKGVKCCISKAVNETDEMLWNDTQDGEDKSGYKEDTGTNCENRDSNTDW